SAKTLPLLGSTSGLLIFVFLGSNPFRIVFLRQLQPFSDKLDFLLWRLDTRLRFLLESVEHVDRLGEPDRVDGPVGASLVVHDDPKPPGPPEPLERFGGGVLETNLGKPKGKPTTILHRLGKGFQILPARAYPEQRFRCR